ncbi:MAG: FliH/SctL family protein, partial [Myxococcota bacterium]
ELPPSRSTALGDAAEGIGRIVIGMAEQVIGQSLALHPDVLSAVVRQALGTLPDEDELQIRVSPDDVQRVRDVLPERYEDRVIADSAVSAGCRIVASHASIDATLEAAIEGAKGAVHTWLESRP